MSMTSNNQSCAKPASALCKLNLCRTILYHSELHTTLYQTILGNSEWVQIWHFQVINKISLFCGAEVENMCWIIPRSELWLNGKRSNVADFLQVTPMVGLLPIDQLPPFHFLSHFLFLQVTPISWSAHSPFSFSLSLSFSFFTLKNG